MQEASSKGEVRSAAHSRRFAAEVTQQNAAMVEQATAASHLLNSDAGKLSEMTSHFVTTHCEDNPIVGVEPSVVPTVPSAHGDDWSDEPVFAPRSADNGGGSAAQDLWQDF